jgi:hypothetical protein
MEAVSTEPGIIGRLEGDLGYEVADGRNILQSALHIH